jgi:hypothetical protein
MAETDSLPTGTDVAEETQSFEIKIDDGVKQESGVKSARKRAAATSYTPDYRELPTRRPASERDSAFKPLGWLLDGATGLIGELRHNDLGLPEEFWIHAYAARREGILAVQAILNDILSRAESRKRKEINRRTRQERRGNIEIDF